jgi:hypothetical protein
MIKTIAKHLVFPLSFYISIKNLDFPLEWNKDNEITSEKISHLFSY